MGATKVADLKARSWQKVGDDVFLAALFAPEECASMLQSIRRQSEDEGVTARQANSMQEYGIVLKDAALAETIAKLVNVQLREAIRRLFPEFPHYNFSAHYAFLTSYGEDANQDLSLHVDSSHLTMNICLDTDVEGTELFFTGARCREHVGDAPDKHSACVRFRRGEALLHIGNQRHFVTPLISGTRHNLVIWCRLEGELCEHSNAWIRSRCPACRKSC